MLKLDFVREYMAVQQDSFKEQTLLQAWKKSRAWPINHNVFTDVDFALSIPYSTMVCDLLATFSSSNSNTKPPDDLTPDSDPDLESDSSCDNDSNNGDNPDTNNNDNNNLDNSNNIDNDRQTDP